jgi:hypothetical protein
MAQVQLSQAQTVILGAACARADGLVFPITAKIKGGAVGNVCKSLLKQRLIEEIPAVDLDTVWRHDETHGPITLRATPLAFRALGIVEDSEQVRVSNGADTGSLETAKSRHGSKQALLIAMLRTPDGATIEEIVAATGWQSHTVRGAMSGALKKKLGLTITSQKVEGRGRVYAICGE